jgi:hypothetical protein
LAKTNSLLALYLFVCYIQVTKKSFKFASQHELPFFFVSAADGANVVQVSHTLLAMYMHSTRLYIRAVYKQSVMRVPEGRCKVVLEYSRAVCIRSTAAMHSK